MSILTKKLLTLLTSCLLISTASLSAAEEKPLSFSTTKVAPGLYMLMGVGGFTGGNIGLSVGDDGVVMIDDSMPPMLDIMKTAISSVTEKPVDFLINTHVHDDHVGNNETFGNGGTWIVAHKNLRKYMMENGKKTKDGVLPTPKSALPVITFPHSMNFYLNGHDARIFHLPHAHTDGDAVIHYQKANVIHTGDILFNGMFPFIDIDKGGCAYGYLQAQRKILEIANDNTKIIPGHGPLATKKDLAASNAVLEDSINIIADLIASGKDEEQVIALNPLAKYHDDWNWGFITTEKMTRQVFKSLIKVKDHKHDGDHKMHSDKDHQEHLKNKDHKYMKHN